MAFSLNPRMKIDTTSLFHSKEIPSEISDSAQIRREFTTAEIQTESGHSSKKTITESVTDVFDDHVSHHMTKIINVNHEEINLAQIPIIGRSISRRSLMFSRRPSKKINYMMISHSRSSDGIITRFETRRVGFPIKSSHYKRIFHNRGTCKRSNAKVCLCKSCKLGK